MQPNQIKQFLNFFDLCGFCSGSSNWFCTRRSINFVMFAHFLLAIFFTFSQFYYFRVFYSNLEMLETISELVEVSATLYTYYLIILDANVHRTAHKYFWDILWQIDNCFCSQFELTCRIYIFKLVIFFLLTFLILIRNMWFSLAEFLTISIHLVIVKICQIRLLYYLFCLEVINSQLKKIEHELVTMKGTHAIVNFQMQSFHAFEMQRFRWIREYFHCIYDMVEIVNEIFGWSQVAAILLNFHCLFTDFNYFYIHYHELHVDEICGTKILVFLITKIRFF